jgi:hypothetical protein
MGIIYTDGFATISTTFWTLNSPTDWSAVSGKARSINPITSLITKAAAHAAIADVKVSYKRALTGTNWDTGVLARTNSTGTTGYFLDPIGTGPSNTMDIWRIDGPAMTNDVQIGTTTTGLTLNDGDIYALECTGTGATVTLKGYLNGALVCGPFTDSSGSRIVTPGQTGIINWNNTNDFDDFLVDDLLSTTFPPVPESVVFRSQLAAVLAR